MSINPSFDSIRDVLHAHRSLNTSKKEQHAVAQIIANEKLKTQQASFSFLKKIAITWHTIGSGAKEYDLQKKANRLLKEVAAKVFDDKWFSPKDPSEKDYETQLDELIKHKSCDFMGILLAGHLEKIKLYLTLFSKEKQQAAKNDLLLQALNFARYAKKTSGSVEMIMLYLIEDGADIHHRNEEGKKLGQLIVHYFPATSKIAQEAAKRLQADIPSTGFTFAELPSELQQNVLSHLPIKEAFEMRRVSKEVKSHIDDETFYRALLSHHFPNYTPSDRLPLLKQIEILQKMQEHPIFEACIDALGGPVEFEKLPIVEFDDEMIMSIERNQLNLPAYHMTDPVMRGFTRSGFPFVAICTLSQNEPSAIVIACGRENTVLVCEGAYPILFPRIVKPPHNINFETQCTPHLKKLLAGKTIQNKCLLHPEFTPQKFKNTRLQGEVLLFDKRNPEEQKNALKEIERLLQEGADLHSPYRNHDKSTNITIAQYVSRHFPVDSEIARLIAKYAADQLTEVSPEQMPDDVVQEIASHLSIEEAIQMRRISKGIKEEDNEFYKFLIQQHFPTYQLQPENKMPYLRQLQILTHFKNHPYNWLLESIEGNLSLPILDLGDREANSVTLKEMEGPIVRSLIKKREAIYICTQNIAKGPPCLHAYYNQKLITIAGTPLYLDDKDLEKLINGQVVNGQRLMTQEEVAQLNASS